MYSLINCFGIVLTSVLHIESQAQHSKSQGIHHYLLEVNFLYLKSVINNFYKKNKLTSLIIKLSSIHANRMFLI